MQTLNTNRALRVPTLSNAVPVRSIVIMQAARAN